MNRNLLLISNSTLHGSGYLDHCAQEITTFLENKKTILFIPYARPDGITHDQYTTKAHERFKQMHITLTGIHQHPNPIKAIHDAEALFIGGGNTFVLLNQLYKNNLIKPIQQKVNTGMPYIGTSAGSNVACASIKTTNDMPIQYPPSFTALNLVPINLNPHYLDPDPTSKHQGETRETRIKEFHYYNTEPVIGLREGAMLHITNTTITLKGTTNARLFTYNQPPKEYQPGDTLNFLLK